MEWWLLQTCGATTCAQLPRLFLVFQQQGNGPKSSLELVWDGKFADKYFCLRCTAGVILKHVSHWIEPQCPCSDELDGDPFTGFLPFPDPTFLPVFPGIIFQIRHTYCIVISASALGVCHFRSFLPKSYSFSCIFPVLQDPALPSQATPAHSFLSSDIPSYIRYILSVLQRLNIIEHLMESGWIGWAYHSH